MTARCIYPLLTFLALLFSGFVHVNGQNPFFCLRDEQSVYHVNRQIFSSGNLIHTCIQPILADKMPDSLSGENFFMDFPLVRHKNTRIEVYPLFDLTPGYSSYYDSFEGGAFAGGGIDAAFGTKWAVRLAGTYGVYTHDSTIGVKSVEADIVPGFSRAWNTTDRLMLFSPASAYVAFRPNQHLVFQAGYDKQFWGDGYRSLLLSENSAPFPFFKIVLEAWKLKYIILYTSLNDVNPDDITGQMQKKYSTMHMLSLNVGKRLNFNVFESVVWAAYDSTGFRGYEVNYLNPVILFRPLEYTLGSPDNVLLGAGARWEMVSGYHLYAQTMIDEFHFRFVKQQAGYWGDKAGFQIGIRAFNFLNINKLDMLCEFNRVRPYTYSHSDPIRNWGHNYQPLAHPLGANFSEMVCLFHYQATSKLALRLRMTYADFGTDADSVSYGGDMYKSYYARPFDFGHETGQGVSNSELNLGLKAFFRPKADRRLQYTATLGMLSRNVAGSSHTGFYFFAGLNTPFFSPALCRH